MGHARPENPANTTPFPELPAISGKAKKREICGKAACKSREHGGGSSAARRGRHGAPRTDTRDRKGLGWGDGDAEEEMPEVRGLLFRQEHALRTEPGRAVPHLPA